MLILFVNLRFETAVYLLFAAMPCSCNDKIALKYLPSGRNTSVQRFNYLTMCKRFVIVLGKAIDSVATN